jgi:hypothetical protein
MQRPHTNAATKAYELIRDKLRTMATETMVTYSDPMDPKLLYEQLIPYGVYQTLVNASLLMPQSSGYMIDNLKIHTQLTPEVTEVIEYALVYNGRSDRTQWLWPKHLNVISYDNDFGHKLIPVVDIAIQWQTTISLYELFYNHNQIPMSITMQMLPWLKFVIPTVYSDSKDPSAFRYLKRMMEVNAPRHIPEVSRWFGSVCRYGTELVSLHSLNKPKQSPSSWVTMLPVLKSSLVEDGLTDHFNEFYKTMIGVGQIKGDDLYNPYNEDEDRV